ncbi:MAG: TetR/AcrR family transcriptional regulator [Clostridiales bacterium]|nr:TetR/AcrR family transcriptional regulator [Clostridiales bacterium]
MKQSRGTKREQLLEVARKLFLKFGTKRVTVEEICKESNVSKVTFYKHFENKTAIIKAIRDDMMESGFSKFDEISLKDLPFVEKIKLMSKWRVEFLSNIQGEFLDDVLVMEDFKNEFMVRFIDNIKQAQTNGEIRKEISPELIWLVTEKMREVTIEGEWKNAFEDYATYQDQIRTIFFFGMLTDENR